MVEVGCPDLGIGMIEVVIGYHSLLFFVRYNIVLTWLSLNHQNSKIKPSVQQFEQSCELTIGCCFLLWVGHQQLYIFLLQLLGL